MEITFEVFFEGFAECGGEVCGFVWVSWGGGSSLFSDDLLVSVLGVLVIKHRLALERVLVQWGFLWELSKGYLCGH